jgi:long-chain acyl-CoA synthetase
MHPSETARLNPGKAALIMPDCGAVLTYGELDRRSNQAAHVFRHHGCRIGDAIAVLLPNTIRYHEIVWGAQRSGLYFVCISSRLTAPEVAYIVKDSGAKLLVTSSGVEADKAALGELLPGVALFSMDEDEPGYANWDALAAGRPETPIADERAGIDMLYSSGTTGRPKGVYKALPENPDINAESSLALRSRKVFGMDENTVYLSPAPLYHAAPLRFTMSIQELGGTIVMMEHFEAERALALIEEYKVTASQWVPTHFVRMLKLPDEARNRYDLSTHRLAIHAAAPCPVPVKKQMIEWWGPILHEYYGGSESIGFTSIESDEWLTHPGSVGKAKIGFIHICDENDNELPPGETGVVYFQGGPKFEYRNDPQKTTEAYNRHGWATFGDIGWVDAEGYLYLTDRKSFMIISGGVNIYPQEIENLLVTHPKIADAAVIGAPDPEMGEKVVAVIQPVDWADATDAFAEELRMWTRERLSGVKTPRRFDFLQELPRHPTGKLYKRLLRDRYWGKRDTTIV